MQLESQLLYPTSSAPSPTQYLAVYIDFENLAIWADDEAVTIYLNDLVRFLAQRGRIAIKNAYANWKNFDEYRYDMTLNAIDLVQIYSVGQGKNRADIRIALDALEAAFQHPHITTFVIVSGDSDFGPLANKLQKYGKKVIGIGPPGDRSHRLFIRACDEFLFLDRVLNLRPRRTEWSNNNNHQKSVAAEIPIIPPLPPILKEEEEEEPETIAVPEPVILEALPLGDPESVRDLWQDILAVPLEENLPISPTTAQKLATEAMEARKNQRYGRCVSKFLLANRVLWEAINQNQPDAELTELRWYMASYASVKAGQLLNRRTFAEARTYYLSFFALLGVSGNVRSRVEGLVNPMLTYYWGSAFREMGLRMPTGYQNRMLSPAELGLYIQETDNSELKQMWDDLVAQLEQANPDLLKEVLAEMSEIEKEVSVSEPI